MEICCDVDGMKDLCLKIGLKAAFRTIKNGVPPGRLGSTCFLRCVCLEITARCCVFWNFRAFYHVVLFLITLGL